jgi:hypothetical protein
MHLLETRYQWAWMDAEYPGVVKHLDSIGLLSSRLSLAHCVWARPEELELLAEHGVTILISNSSNLHLRSGIAPVAQNAVAGELPFVVDPYEMALGTVKWFQLAKRVRVYSAAERRQRCVCPYLSCRESRPHRSQ